MFQAVAVSTFSVLHKFVDSVKPLATLFLILATFPLLKIGIHSVNWQLIYTQIRENKKSQGLW